MTTLSQITCPNCQTVNSLQTTHNGAWVCSNCGVVIDKESSGLLQDKSQKSFDSRSDLELGLKGNLENEELEIVGYILYQGQDDEDTWYWEEWFATGQDGYYWIQYDVEEDSYTLFKQATPKQAVDISQIRSGASIWLSPEERFTVREVGLAKVNYVAGEIPWQATIGDVIHYADGSYYNQKYSIEWTEEEIEIYKGREIDRKELFAGLGMKEKLAELIKKERSELKWKFIRIILWSVVVGCIVGLVLSFISGKEIFSQVVSFCPEQPAFNNTEFLAIPSEQNCDDTEFPIGPVNLTHLNKIYKIEIESTSATRTNWVSLDVNLLNSANHPLSGLEGDFWVEDWREGGESGTDANYKATKLFQLTEAGQYYLDMEVDKQNPNSEVDTFIVKIYEDVILSRYFLLLGTLALLVLGSKEGWLTKME